MSTPAIYVRSPGGILTECAATAPGGFARDEPFDQLGTSLLLPPPWFEDKRPDIIAMLEPIVVPEANRPVAVRSGAPAPQQEPAPASSSGAGASRRTSATFIGGDGSSR
jgi:hypothetical protein